ncbi:hypothetical protein G9C98_008152 [Cotesia typhae]|uniref:PABS domain-containing protein n=1 Tax=Cotesia typhae TaxID=2053667 RepID=A0A8J5R6Z6_9HYME|nr:hypothetical protein G9C98_008152 [Cotesia typhae]
MDAFKKGWFSEFNDLWPGISVSFEVTKILHHEKSQFQDILLVDTKSHGRLLVLDGIIQCSESDEFSYQEMISFLPLCTHPNPKNVLIVGGGDGGVAREIVKHPGVEHVTQVEIDGRVLELSRQYLPSLACGLSHPKTALKSGGLVCSQAGTIWSNDMQVEKTLGHCKSVFPAASYAYTSVPTYPTGQIGFVMGSLDPDTKFGEPVKVFTEKELEEMKLKYYDDKIHRSAFVLPRFAAKAIKNLIK